MQSQVQTHTHTHTLTHTQLLPWSPRLLQPAQSCHCEPTDRKQISKAVMSQPCLHHMVVPHRTHSHHSLMKGDHPPLFGFRQMQEIITTAEAPMVGGVPKAAELLRIRTQNKPRKQWIIVISSDVISRSSCQEGCSSFCKCLLSLCQQPVSRSLQG